MTVVANTLKNAAETNELDAKIEAALNQKMGAYELLLSRQAEEINRLKATLNANQANQTKLEAQPTSRRKLLKRLAVVAGATVAATALTAQPQAAQAATGGNMLIGQSNTPTAVGDETLLVSPNVADLMPNTFRVTNRSNSGLLVSIPDNTRIAIAGRTGGDDASAPAGGVTRVGVWGGTNQSGYGVWGQSEGGRGVYGLNTSAVGVWGESTSGAGVFGTSTSSYGVRGVSNSDYGVYGSSDATHGVRGVSSAGAFNLNASGVTGSSVNSIGVLANSTNSYSLYVGNTTNTGAPVYFQVGAVANTGAPTAGLHQAGELWRGSGTRDGLYYCIVPGTPGTWVQIAGTGSIGNLHFLATPFRVAATVNAGGSNPLLVAVGSNPGNGNSSSALIQVAGVTGSGIPTTARGVVGSITNVGSTSGGNLRVWAGGANVPTVNNLNIPGNLGAYPNLTTAFNVGLNPAGQLTIGYGTGSVGATTGYNVDISGYYE
jgi:hypothetical protein